MAINVLDHGAIPNDSSSGARTANYNAFVNAQKTQGNGGLTIEVPPGTYYFPNGGLDLLRPVIMRGTGPGVGNGYPTTTLKFPSGSNGITIHRASTSPDGGDASGAVLSDLYILAEGKSGTANGVQFWARCTLVRICSEGFSQHGFYCNTDPSGRNANRFEMLSCSSNANDGCGFYVRGSDSNAGYVRNFSAVGNATWGVVDVSLTGSTYIQCHTDSNGLSKPLGTGGGQADGTGGAYYIANAGVGGVLFNCYSEGGQNPSYLNLVASAIGGTHGAGFSTDTFGLVIDGRSISSFQQTVTNPSVAGGRITNFQGGGQSQYGAQLLTYENQTSGVSDNGMTFGSYDETGRTWALAQLVNVPVPSLVMAGFGTSGFAGGRLIAPLGLHLGGANTMVQPGPKIWASNGNPIGSGTTWLARIGDFIHNQHGATDGVAGWVCTVNCGDANHWFPNDGPYYPDALVTPTVRNGFVYRRTPASTGSSGGASEPTWPTTVGLTVADGQIVWECFGSTDSGLQPLYFDNVRIGTQATASGPVGSIVKKVPIYDQAGTLLGYIPVYNSIT